MDAAWISEYKKETDRSRRWIILEREREEHSADPEFEIREKLLLMHLIADCCDFFGPPSPGGPFRIKIFKKIGSGGPIKIK